MSIEKWFDQHGVCPGMKRIPWDEATIGSEVFVCGLRCGVTDAYGPHRVMAKGKLISSSTGMIFLEPDETLLVPE